MVVRHVLALFMALGLLTACLDKQNSPYVRNQSSSPVSVIIYYDGRPAPSKGTLAPYSNLGHAESGLRITAIEARYPSGTVVTADKAGLEKELQSNERQQIEVWILNEAGISRGTKQDWDRIKGKGAEESSR